MLNFDNLIKKKQYNIKGITKRWLINCFGLILIVLLAIEFAISFVIKAFFYDEMPKSIISWAGESAEKTIYFLVATVFIGGILIAFLVGISNFYFIKSIINPIKHIGEIAKQIAQGDFDIKIEKRFDDEVGELCDAINYMAAELRNSEKMKNDFISSISHELRTPLTAIKGWAETIHLSSEPDAEVNKKGMYVITREAERLCGIVEELLDFSSIQNGRMTMMMDKIDLLAELTEAVYIFRNRTENQKKHLLYAEPSSLSLVMGDKNRLRQVFINVIDNALKYTSEGGIVNVSVTQTDNYISVNVSDNGCGIPAIHLPKVKDKFYKANQTQIGAGIGLALADEIVNMHGGDLTIVSEENVGTTVTISLPALIE
ncbi:MAG: HAMP domain-containing histidine kinase [Oscillospiraceae bacterium]|jgi:signal transduction histidine kinase|nr:HAMP domain-containing histidine kinase [Oscillospiraceae bacterium]